jgi:hypothetical protein
MGLFFLVVSYLRKLLLAGVSRGVYFRGTLLTEAPRGA